MGILKGGAFDAFIGKVGNLVGSTWKGISVLRSKPAKRKNKTLSQAQLDQQARFSVACDVLHRLNPLLNITYKKFTKEKSAFNSAMAYTLENSITGIYPNYTIDWTKLLVSRGSLPHPSNLTATANQTTVEFEWDETNINLPSLGSDKSILVIYCPDMKEFAYTWTGSSRMTGSAIINVSNFRGKAIHTWISFISDDGKRVSNSRYMGQLTVA